MGAPGLSRRRAVTGVLGWGVGLPVLAGCTGDDTTTSASDPTSSSGGGSPTPVDPTAPATSPTSGAPTGGFASTVEIPVGGGAVFEEQRVVVTQPTEGEFRAFSFVCTHAGCPVNQVTDEILCPCHKSRFSLMDGTPTAGPASSPLDPVELVIDENSISLA